MAVILHIVFGLESSQDLLFLDRVTAAPVLILAHKISVSNVWIRLNFLIDC